MRKVNNEILLSYNHNQSIDELFIGMFYCKHLLDCNTSDSKEEFDDLVEFFFDNKKKVATEKLKELYSLYKSEYFKKRLN